MLSSTPTFVLALAVSLGVGVAVGGLVVGQVADCPQPEPVKGWSPKDAKALSLRFSRSLHTPAEADWPRFSRAIDAYVRGLQKQQPVVCAKRVDVRASGLRCLRRRQQEFERLLKLSNKLPPLSASGALTFLSPPASCDSANRWLKWLETPNAPPPPTSDPDKIEAIGVVYLGLGQLGPAGRFLSSANKAFGDRAQQSRVRLNLARIAELTGDFDQFLQHAIVAARTASVASDAALLPQSKLTIGWAQERSGKNARPQFDRTRVWIVTHLPRGDPMLAQVLAAIAHSAVRNEDPERAATTLDEAITILRQRWGAEHPAVAELQDARGWVEQARGRSGAATRYHLLALKTRKKAFGPSHNLVNLSLLGAASAQLDIQLGAEAVAHGEQVVRNLKKPDRNPLIWAEAKLVIARGHLIEKSPRRAAKALADAQAALRRLPSALARLSAIVDGLAASYPATAEPKKGATP